MADTILAHQMNSEDETTVKRSPETMQRILRSF